MGKSKLDPKLTITNKGVMLGKSIMKKQKKIPTDELEIRYQEASKNLEKVSKEQDNKLKTASDEQQNILNQMIANAVNDLIGKKIIKCRGQKFAFIVSGSYKKQTAFGGCFGGPDIPEDDPFKYSYPSFHYTYIGVIPRNGILKSGKKENWIRDHKIRFGKLYLFEDENIVSFKRVENAYKEKNPALYLTNDFYGTPSWRLGNLIAEQFDKEIGNRMRQSKRVKSIRIVIGDREFNKFLKERTPEEKEVISKLKL